MDVSAASELIRNKLSFRASSTSLNTRILSALNEAQRDLEKGKTLPKFLLQEDQTLTGSANSPTLTLPAGFLRLSEEEGIWWDGDSSEARRKLQRGDLNQLKEIWTGTTRTTPVAYALRKATIMVFPTPTAAHTYTYSYYKAGDVLVSDENVWLANAPDLLISQAGLLVAADLQDDAAITKFTALQRSAQSAVFFKTIDDELQDEFVIMGGNN